MESRIPRVMMRQATQIPRMNIPRTNIPNINPVMDPSKKTLNLRRSRSCAELSRNPYVLPRVANGINRAAVRAPLAPKQPTANVAVKRKADPAPVATSKTARVQTKPTRKSILKASTSKPVVTKPKKPPPYDYKARFQLLQEKHETLKSNYTDISEKYARLTNDMAKYMEDSENLIQKIAECEQKTTKIQELEGKLAEEKEKLAKQKKEFDELKKAYQATTSLLKTTQENLKTLDEDHNKLKKTSEEVIANYDELKMKYNEQKNIIASLSDKVFNADLERRILHNQIQDLKGNIRVFCRVRPPLPEERGRYLIDINYLDECTLEVSSENVSGSVCSRRVQKQEFSFNHVFSEESTQEQVFLELGPLVQSVLDGYNVCVFAYGQTGSGKTFTMEGGYTPETIGIIPRTINLLFQTIEERKHLKWTYEVKASFLEIYNEQIYDLLNNENLPHDIRMVDARGLDVYVTNLQIETITDSDQLKQLLMIAQKNRAVATTIMNERSSRSHAVTKIEITSRNSVNNECYRASLSLVDLAGSERARDSEVVRLTETKNINKSLSNLSNVILSLLQKKDHIPYRDSKLTHLLMPSLGGNSKTLMFVNISPLIECYNETLNSLRFAAKVNNCKISSVRRNKV